MSGKIIFLAGPSQYGVIARFLAELANGFVAIGKEVEIIPLDTPQAGERLGKALAGEVDFVFSYNGLALDARAGDESLWDRSGVLFVTALIDHPYHQIERLSLLVRNLLTTCVDRRHVDFLKLFVGEEARAAFFPHFGMASKEGDATARDIDILMPGTLGDYRHLVEGWRELPLPVRQLAEAVCDEMVMGESIPLEQAIPVIAAQRGLPVAEDVYSLLPEIDLAVRQRRREMALTALADVGVIVDIIGSVSPTLTQLSGHRVHPPVSIDESVAMMGRAKIVLNVGPNFCDGSHERVFTAMLNGALVATDRNDYWPTILTDEVDCVIYRWGDLPTLGGRLERLLSDHAKREAIADAGRRIASTDHTPRARAEMLLAIVEQNRLDS